MFTHQSSTSTRHVVVNYRVNMSRERSSSNSSLQKLKYHFDEKFESISKDIARCPEKSEKVSIKTSCKVQYEFNEKQLKMVKDAISLMEKGAVNRSLEKLYMLKKISRRGTS